MVPILAGKSVRVVAGAGGVGKTRLALKSGGVELPGELSAGLLVVARWGTELDGNALQPGPSEQRGDNGQHYQADEERLVDDAGGVGAGGEHNPGPAAGIQGDRQAPGHE